MPHSDSCSGGSIFKDIDSSQEISSHNWLQVFVGEQKLTVVDSIKVPSVCHQNNELQSLAQKEQRDLSAEVKPKVVSSHFLDCYFSVSEMKSEKWNGFLDLTQMWKPVGDTRKEFVLWGDVVTDVAVFGRF